MDFDVSEEQQMLRDGLRALLADASDIRHVRAVACDGDALDPGLWSTLAEAGWTGLTVPGHAGGAGLGFEELMLIAVEAGRAVLHLPLVVTLLAARVIARDGDLATHGRMLERVASGTDTITVAIRGAPTDWNGERAGVVAEPDGDGWRLTGELTMVPYGPGASFVLVEAAPRTGNWAWFLVPTGAQGVRWTALTAMDRTVRQFHLALDGVRVPADAALLGRDGRDVAFDAALDEWRTLLAAESLGACEVLLERSVAYAKERVAFGRPIGSNQAIKTRIADMAGQIERMRATVYFAAMKLQAGDEDGSLAAAMAKAAASAPAVFVGSQAIHVHGGIGYTWEHDMHLYFKRVKSNELLLGDETASLRRIAACVV